MAVSDDLGLYAHTRAAIRTRSLNEAVQAVARMVEQESIAEVIIGLPLTLAGARGHQVEATRPLVEALRAALNIPVREVDERLSSAQAVATQPKFGGKRDGSLDSAAAAVVLQGVLDARRPRSPR
ncbi:MAG: Holliday junction resolvase RuvX [Dehalococcoidia bacterium]